VSLWRQGQREAAVADLTPCFYRAPTDNDRGGAGGSAYASRCGPDLHLRLHRSQRVAYPSKVLV